MRTSGFPVIYSGHRTYDKNINYQNDSNRNHLPGADYLYEHSSDFTAEHKNKVYFSGDPVKAVTGQQHLLYNSINITV